VATKARRYEAAAAADGIELVIVSTLRDAEMQERLYAFGRTRPGPRWSAERPTGIPVTNHAPGHSYHQYGMAFDAYPLVDGRLLTECTAGELWCWRLLQEIAHSRGINLRVGLDLKFANSRREYWHHEYTGGLTIDDLLAGQRIPDVDI